MLKHVSFALLVAAAPLSAQDADSAKVVHLLARATFGVRTQDVTAVRQIGVQRWLDQQLQPDRVDDATVASKLQRFDVLRMSIAELAKEYAPPRQTPEYRKALDSLRAMGEQPNQQQLRQMLGGGQRMNTPQRLLGELVAAKLIRSAESNRQLEEVMTDFWFNHFNVFFQDGPVRYLVKDYEENAIRPHVFGKFYDLLHATAMHPAMLVYLDNAMSAVPDSENPYAGRINAAMRNRPQQQQQRQRRPNGLNENYARELMELHTLGVDGGYTQQDVIEVARAFTGWTVRREGGAPSDFRFVPFIHDGKPKTVLGHTLKGGRGIEDGEDVLKMLARDPHTAQHIARQLLQRFVTDDPPADYVTELASVFLKTDGDLREVTRALFTSPKFYDTQFVNKKVKTPFELVVSAIRTTGREVPANRELIMTLRTLGQLPYTERAPTGFSDKASDWVNSGALLARMNFGSKFAQQVSPGDKSLALLLGSPEFQMK